MDFTEISGTSYLDFLDPYDCFCQIVHDKFALLPLVKALKYKIDNAATLDTESLIRAMVKEEMRSREMNLSNNLKNLKCSTFSPVDVKDPYIALHMVLNGMQLCNCLSVDKQTLSNVLGFMKKLNVRVKLERRTSRRGLFPCNTAEDKAVTMELLDKEDAKTIAAAINIVSGLCNLSGSMTLDAMKNLFITGIHLDHNKMTSLHAYKS